MNTKTEITLLVVEDHVLIREAIVGLLSTQPGFRVLGEAGTVAEAVSLSRKLKPTVILMDYGLPDGTGLEATNMILEENPETNIIFLTVHEADDTLFSAIRSGAKGYLLKNIPAAKMVAAIKGFVEGEAPISRTMASRILGEFSREHHHQQGEIEAGQVFTPRETDVLAALVGGMSNAEIANHLSITISTVKNHVHNMLSKLELKNRRDLVRYARQYGLVENLPG